MDTINTDMRALYMDAVDLANKYEHIPWEAKRLIFQVVGAMIEKKADEKIKMEYENLDVSVDEVILGGE